MPQGSARVAEGMVNGHRASFHARLVTVGSVSLGIRLTFPINGPPGTQKSTVVIGPYRTLAPVATIGAAFGG